MQKSAKPKGDKVEFALTIPSHYFERTSHTEKEKNPCRLRVSKTTRDLLSDIKQGSEHFKSVDDVITALILSCAYLGGAE